MKLYITTILCLFFTNLLAQVDQDGPYVKRFAKQVIVQSILNDVVKIDTLIAAEAINVEFSVKKEWNFNFKLQERIQTPPSTYQQPGKLLVLSDIEGEFSAFRALMLGNKVMDEQYNWIFGKGHLVICGDLFDRGKEVMPYLWLLYKLEQSALKNGGFVHVILGNHDVMNMAGDFRYQASKYPAAAQLLGNTYPNLIAQDTEIGKWLRSKNVIEKIGNRLFLHGGISAKVNAMNWSLEQINHKCRSYYGVATKELSTDGKIMMGGNGPIWYRGYFAKEQAPMSTIDSTLKKFNVKQIVVGHTITANNIASYHGGKVIGVDVDQHHGNHKALLVLNGESFVVDEKGKRYPLLEAGN